MSRVVLVAGLALALAAPLAAAEAVKVSLTDFKWKPAFKDGDELGGYDAGEERFYFYTNGTATGDVTVPEDGEYTVTVEASCTEALKELAKFKVTCGETEVAKEHACTAEERKKYTFTAKLKKGKQPLVITFLNDAYKENEYDRNLFVHVIAVEQKKQ